MHSGLTICSLLWSLWLSEKYELNEGDDGDRINNDDVDKAADDDEGGSLIVASNNSFLTMWCMWIHTL